MTTQFNLPSIPYKCNKIGIFNVLVFAKDILQDSGSDFAIFRGYIKLQLSVLFMSQAFELSNPKVPSGSSKPKVFQSSQTHSWIIDLMTKDKDIRMFYSATAIAVALAVGLSSSTA